MFEQDEHPRTFAQRCSDAVAVFCGSWSFVLWFSLLVIGWVALNSWWILVGTFDPYPYIALNLVLTIVSTFQGPLIMMSQNRQADRDREAVQAIHAKLDKIMAVARAANCEVCGAPLSQHGPMARCWSTPRKTEGVPERL